LVDGPINGGIRWLRLNGGIRWLRFNGGIRQVGREEKGIRQGRGLGKGRFLVE
jgi:hypothetical protein